MEDKKPKAILNVHDDLLPNVDVGVGDYVVANTNEFRLIKGDIYEIVQVNAYDMITIEVNDEEIDMFSIEYFDEYIEE